jgi:ribosomal protein S18 acetylase RimI-like enzyme
LTNGEQLPSFCYGITEDEIKRRTNAGHRYYVIQESGKIVCSCWIGFGTVSYGGPSIYLYSNHPIFDLEPGHAWLYDIICQDEHRGKGLGTMLYREILRDLGSEGISLVTATVGEDNIANIKVLLRSDFILKEFVRYRRWLIFRCRNRKVLNEKDLEFLRKKLGR